MDIPGIYRDIPKLQKLFQFPRGLVTLVSREELQFQEKLKFLTCNGRPNAWRLLTDHKMQVLPAFYQVRSIVLPGRKANIEHRLQAIGSIETETKATGSALSDEQSDSCEENRASQVHSIRKGRIPRRSAARSLRADSDSERHTRL